ncbi:MAG TPA: SCO family protein [Acetobacteraceae bacterium]|nr:SCO family protein [Acetobacteraceae bacterium]
MLTRRSLLFLAPAGVLAAGLGGAAWLALRPEAPIPIGGPFELVDGAGRTVTEQQFRGKWMLVYFGYTHCPDACPTALQDMANAMDLLGEKKRDVALVFITVDPERDTPAVMKDYVSGFEAPITALSGTPEQVARAAKAYRVYYAKHPTKDGYDMDHSSIIYVMDPRGRFVANFTHESSPEQIAARLRTLV